MTTQQIAHEIRQTQLFIDGSFVDAADGATIDVLDPAHGDLLTRVQAAGPGDIDAAVAAARRALEGPWGQMDVAARKRLLVRAAELLRERTDELALVEALDSGKPLTETRIYPDITADCLEFFIEMAQFVRSHVIPTPNGFLNYTLRQPVGVVAAIVPWNFPLPFCGAKCGPILAMGNTVVLKPAEQTPLSALLFAEACRDAGIPDGVVNVVPGVGTVAGRRLVEHPDVAMVTFTGSTEVGREIASVAGRGLKPVVLELGGKAPNIVFADADLEQAARTALYMFAYNAGQVCSAGTRLLVERPIHDTFVDEVTRQARETRVGDPLDPVTQVGAVVSAEQLQRIEGYVALGREEGAEVVHGGRAAVVAGHERGWFYEPTIFRDVDTHMRIAQEEIFGPVVAVMPFEDDAHALHLANDVLYGLTAGIWTSNVSRAHEFARRVEAGIVFINTMNDGRGLASPFGGWKQSGIGLENGVEGLLSFTRQKSVILNVGNDTPSL